MGVMVPESDIVGDVGRRRSLLLLFGLIFVLISASGAVWLSRRYARMLGDVRTIAETTEEDVLELIAKGENRYIEFKSTLRMNLHSKKPGKEIELAWLKGVAAFLNTDGGTLLLGVTDDGEVTGLERDVFENNDKCRLHFKNLVATHIGAEMSKYIRFRIVSVAGKTVGVVYCARSPEPVFLKNGNKEAFYIRNGPSSDELPVSKALKYIKNRK
jgi:predicted HTH transcriptional regulator